MGQKYVFFIYRSSKTALLTLHSLAWCELYLMFAALFRRFDMELDGMR